MGDSLQCCWSEPEIIQVLISCNFTCKSVFINVCSTTRCCYLWWNSNFSYSVICENSIWVIICCGHCTWEGCSCWACIVCFSFTKNRFKRAWFQVAVCNILLNLSSRQTILLVLVHVSSGVIELLISRDWWNNWLSPLEIDNLIHSIICCYCVSCEDISVCTTCLNILCHVIAGVLIDINEISW